MFWLHSAMTEHSNNPPNTPEHLNFPKHHADTLTHTHPHTQYGDDLEVGEIGECVGDLDDDA